MKDIRHDNQVRPKSACGQLEILNVGAGDMLFKFDQDNQEELKRAKVMITDMLHRGFVLMVEIDGAFQRVTEFDATKNTYTIKVMEEYLENEMSDEGKSDGKEQTTESKKRNASRGRPRTIRKEIPIQKTRAVAFARTAGG